MTGVVPRLPPGGGPEPHAARAVLDRRLGPAEKEPLDLEQVEELGQPVDEEERRLGRFELEAALSARLDPFDVHHQVGEGGDRLGKEIAPA